MRVKKVYFSRRGTSFILSGTFMVRLDKSISGKLQNNNIDFSRKNSRRYYCIRKQIWTNINRKESY